MVHLTKNGRLRVERNPDKIDNLKSRGWVVTEPPILADVEEREVVWKNGDWEIQYKETEYPPPISARQIRLWLLSNGLLNDVKAAISSKPGAAGKAAEIEFEYTTHFKRQHPLVVEIGTALNFTDETLDQLFLEAALL